MRPTKEQIDEDIVDTAARLFARHGYDQTSVQRIADAVGYSKTGLLHRFPSKEALQTATTSMAVDQVDRLAERVGDAPPGPDRDRAVLEQLTDLALQRPGFVALVLGALDNEHPDLERIAAGLFRALGDDPQQTPRPDDERVLRVTVALGGLAVASLACPPDATPATRRTLADAAQRALGHPVPDSPRHP